MGTKTDPGAFDCYANAAPDEPVFVLLGRDKHAPTLIWLWAAMRELEQEDPAKVAEAREVVVQMMQWQIDHGRSAVGLGQAALIGAMDLIRAANGATQLLKDAPKNSATSTEMMRAVLAETRFAKPEADTATTSPEHAQGGPSSPPSPVVPA